MLKNKTDQWGETYILITIKHYKENWRWFKEIERYPQALILEELILLKWPYCPKQSAGLMWSLSNYPRYFHRTRTNNPKIPVETKKTQSYQSNPEEKEQGKRHNPSRLQTTL